MSCIACCLLSNRVPSADRTTRVVAALCALGFGFPLAAQVQRIDAIDGARSEIVFVGKQMGVPAEGRFKRFTAQVDFDPARLAAARTRIEIDLASVDTGFGEVDAELQGKAWFNTASFPTARFVSSAVKSLGGGRYEAAGKMTIKGRTRGVSAPFSVKQQNGTTVFEGVFTLRRLDYGVGEGVWADTEAVADEVQVRFKLTGVTRN